MKKIILLLVVGAFAVSGCSHWKPLKAPCTYDKRNKCGPIIPLQ